jgi:hypothetical protein
VYAVIGVILLGAALFGFLAIREPDVFAASRPIESRSHATAGESDGPTP